MEGSAQRTLDEDALERLYLRLEKPLYNVVYRWLWDSEDTHEVVQEAFVRLWKMRTRVDLLTVDALVYRIALNLASSQRRKRRIWRWVSLETLLDRPTTGASSEDDLVQRQEAETVRAAVDALPEQLKKVVTLCELTDLTHAEIGAILGIRPGTVGSRRHRALERLREKLLAEGF
jgi:RNA polymerase sigma-70 factor (ECF subfamily)